MTETIIAIIQMEIIIITPATAYTYPNSSPPKIHSNIENIKNVALILRIVTA